MSSIEVVGGVYAEICMAPRWRQIYGSGGRAAIALSRSVDEVRLHTYLATQLAVPFRATAESFGVKLIETATVQLVSFEYQHCLAQPLILPITSAIRTHQSIEVTGEVVARFGMLEGTALVRADWCVYDPQSAFRPEPFGANGSTANHLAIVANSGEVAALSGSSDIEEGARVLLASQGAEVVVVKRGLQGAQVVSRDESASVPAYRTNMVWTLGAGDVFAAAFALSWAICGQPPVVAADYASRATAQYVNTRALPVAAPGDGELQQLEAAELSGPRVYLAAPFFSLDKLWIVNEARRHLLELGAQVFSPMHDVGVGSGSEVAARDLEGLEQSDLVLALLDGMDPGTLFECGYATALRKPIYALCQGGRDEDLKMLTGTGARVYDDFVTALHHAIWRT